MATVSQRILGDKYRLIRPLDEGGMGSVWLAEHLSLASPVAVKLIAAEFAKSEERRQRFLREAHASAAVRSPHVVQILDYGVDEGAPYIVMELLEGESLADRLLRRGCLDARETELVIRHVSRAVGRAHELGIVHRDLKPANIFISRDDEEEIIKLFDFGIAKAIPEAKAGAGDRRTRTGSFLGTPVYMSPEQLEASKPCDFRADIWAMGVIAFECLLGRLPFNGAGIGGLVLAISSEPLPVPSEHGAVPTGFDAWFARACARDPNERFASARQAAQELRRMLLPGPDSSEGERLPSDAVGTAPATAPWPGAHAPSDGPSPASPPSHPSTGAASSATIESGASGHGRLLFFLSSSLALWLIVLALQRLLQPPAEIAQAVQGVAAPAPEQPAPDPALKPEAARAPAAGLPDTSAGALASSEPGAESLAPAVAPSPPVRRAVRARARRPVARRAKASLTVTSTPPSRVLIDGAPRGTTPLRSVRVAPGAHRITLIYGKQRKAMRVESAVGENTIVSARFQPEPGEGARSSTATSR